MIRYTLMIACLLLAACGGSDGESLTQKYALRAQASAWENGMPTVLLPGESLPCTSLIVAFSVRAGRLGFPPGVSAKSVSLTKPGVPRWEVDVSTTETGLGNRWVSDTDWSGLVGSADGNPPPGYQSEQVLTGIARGCASESFQEGDELLASILIEAAGEQATVQSTLKLSVAY